MPTYNKKKSLEEEYKQALIEIYDFLEKTVQDTSSYYERFSTEIERREFFGYHRAIDQVFNYVIKPTIKKLNLK